MAGSTAIRGLRAEHGETVFDVSNEQIAGLIIYEGWDAWVYLWKLIFGSVILLLS